MQEHFIQNDFGEEIVVFNKIGNQSFEDFIKKIDEYLGDELGNFI
jgi:Golgi nucleoside diphosphatase